MKLRTWGAAALAVCLAAANVAQLHARGMQIDEELQAETSHEADPLATGAESDFSYYDSVETCPTGGCYDDGGSRGGFLGDLTSRPIQLVIGAEYIYAQATFSEALAYVEQDAAAGVDTFHQIDFDYESSYSFYGGAYLADCGGSVIFDYTRLTSSGEFVADETGGTQIFGPFEIDGNITGAADVDLNSYDLSFSKTIPLGCLMGGAGCGDCCADACCDGGCGSWCPAWDITWSGGIRFADVGWSNGLVATDPQSNIFIDSAVTTLDFQGFGGRVGLMGRRYLGKRGLFSLYGKGDFSVLFGDVDLETTITNIAGDAFLRTSNEVTVPVTEIELGGSAHLGAHATLSAGYFWSAWHDLGMSPTYSFDQTFQVAHFDDANILGWNGFFARAEIAF